MAKKKKPPVEVGQVTLEGDITGLDKLVQKPKVIQYDGLRVIHFAINEEDRSVKGYLAEVIRQARQLLPEAKSTAKPPWMRPEWQAKRRKIREGL